MVSLFPLRTPLTGLGSFSSGPTQPVTLSAVCFNDALPVISPPDVEILTRQFPVTSAAQAGATNDANNNILRNPSRSIMHRPPRALVRKLRGKVHRRSQTGATSRRAIHDDASRIASRCRVLAHLEGGPFLKHARLGTVPDSRNH